MQFTIKMDLANVNYYLQRGGGREVTENSREKRIEEKNENSTKGKITLQI